MDGKNICGPQPRFQFDQPGRGGIVWRKLPQVLEVGDHGIEARLRAR